MLVADGPLTWSGVLAGWQTDPVSVAGLVVEILLAVTYLYAAGRVGRRRRRWPAASTAAFLTGLAMAAVVLQSGLAAHDDISWVHTLQHVVVMSVASVLFALGAPVTLCLQALPTPAARRVVAALHHPAVQALCGRRAAVHLPLDYYGLTVVYLLTPVSALALRNQAVHVTIHLLMLTCGLLFWFPIVGSDPTGWRPAQRTRLVLAGAGIPVNALLAGAVGSVVLLVATEAATVFGMLTVLTRTRHRPAGRAVPPQRQPVVVAATAEVS